MTSGETDKSRTWDILQDDWLDLGVGGRTLPDQKSLRSYNQVSY